MPFGNARYGANIITFPNAPAPTLTVDTTFFLHVGDIVRVSNLADNQTGTGTLNGTYSIISLTPNTVQFSENTTGKAVYISGGIVSIVTPINLYPPPTYIPYIVTNLANQD